MSPSLRDARDPRARFEELSAIIGRPVDLSLDQWHELYGLATSFRPSVILEFGRGYGNSTVALTAAARTVDAKVVSISYDTPSAWHTYSAPRLRRALGRRWFRRLTVLQGRIEEQDVARWIGGASRAMLFWDAHAPGLAGHVIERVFPRLPRPSLVVVHDVSPLTTEPLGPGWFSWRGFCSPFEELPAVGAYLDRARIPVDQWSHMIAFELPKSS